MGVQLAYNRSTLLCKALNFAKARTTDHAGVRRVLS